MMKEVDSFKIRLLLAISTPFWICAGLKSPAFFFFFFFFKLQYVFFSGDQCRLFRVTDEDLLFETEQSDPS